jgi:transposase-like protein
MSMPAKSKANRAKSTKRAPGPRRAFSAQEKCQAVLSVWTGQRKPVEVQKELEINYALLSQWQNTAMEAMLAVFEPRVRKEEDRPPALDPKLEKFLARKVRQRAAKCSRMQQRLMTLQGPASKKPKRG